MQINSALLTFSLMAGFAVAASASTSYSLPTGQTDAGNNPVSASVILSLSQVGATDELTVTVDNQTLNQKSDGENITGINLLIDSSQITGAALVSTSASLIDVGKGGEVTDLGTGPLGHWTASTSLSDLAFTTIGNGAPSYAIIGEPGGSGSYTNANSSITNNSGGKQPYAQGSAVFVFDLAGANISLSSITGAQVGFGTQGNNYINATDITTVQTGGITPTPEPATFWLAGLSFALIGLGLHRKRATVTSER